MDATALLCRFHMACGKTGLEYLLRDDPAKLLEILE
jgi:hypothetical protein